MSRQKIDYGIDLGTTNSAIARADNGEIRIFEIEPSKKTIMPSCVHFRKGSQIYVGETAYSKLWDVNNTFYEFKRNMGTDHTYNSPNTGKSYTPEELSAEVLKALKNSVTDEEFSSSIITVPAGFKQVQCEATRRAAELAGFQYFELLQEPIAASLAYLGDQKNIEGTWLVFDLGGGTFDVALVKMEEGIMKVIDHSGDNRLGGKNMDELIVDDIIIPYFEKKSLCVEALSKKKSRAILHRRLKILAEKAKIVLSNQDNALVEFDETVFKYEYGIDLDTEIEIKRSEFEKIISSLIDRVIDFTAELIAKNNLAASDLITILMVGGPTYIPLLRERIKKEICQNMNVTINPMTAVAIGAALYASIRPIPVKTQKRDYSKVQLTLAYPDTTVESEITLGIRVDKDKTKGKVPSKIWAEILRNDKAWTSGKFELPEGVGDVRLHLKDKSSNGFSVQIFDETGNKLECEPNSISILQGLKIAEPPLPYDIGVSALVISLDKEELMVPILKKGTPLPAVEKKEFVVPKNLRPGKSEDVLNIIVWEGQGGIRPIRNVIMGIMEISGDMLSSLLPAGNKVEITIRMDESRNTKVSAYLPYLDETIEKAMDPDYTHSAISADELSHQINSEQDRFLELKEKSQEIGQFETSDFDTMEKTLNELDNLNEKGRGDYDRGHEVKERLSELATKFDEIENNIKLPQIEKKLEDELERIEEIVDQSGNKKYEQILSQIKIEIEKVKEMKSINRLNNVLDKLLELKWRILFQEPNFWVSVLNNINESFEEIQWSDHSKARALLDRGGDLLASSQFSDEIKSIVGELWDLMPEPDREKTKEPRTDIPHY